MSDLQQARDDLAAGLDQAGWNSYATTPGSAELPAVVIGLPEEIDPTITIGYWQITLPVYVVVASTDDASAELWLLERLPALVSTVKALEGVWAGKPRVVNAGSFFDITVGTTSAISCAVTLEIMLRNPS